MLDHANLDAMCGSVVDGFALTPADHSLLILPLFHVNGIVVGQPTNLSNCGTGPVNLQANQIGGDAKFRAPGQLDYRLAAGSPSINAGVNVPAGGLGPFDLARGQRIEGPKVDRGAYEYP